MMDACPPTPTIPTPTIPTPTETTPTTWPSRLGSWVQKILRQLLTGRDNETHDLFRWGVLYGLLFLTWHDWYQLQHGVQTNVKDVAQALGVLLAGGGAGMLMKKNTEP